MKDDRRNYILVGVFVVAMVTGLVLWIALLSGRTGSTDPYFIRYGDVLGLSEGTQIYFDGYPVGMIESIHPTDDGEPKMFRLDVSIRRGWKIPADSRAEITASGLLSAVVINIVGGESTAYLEPGAQIPSVEAANLLAVMTEAAAGFSEFLLDTLKPQVEAIVADLKKTMEQVNKLLSSQNTERVAKILANLENVSEEVEGMTSGLEGTRQQVDQVLGRVDRVLGQVDGVIVQASELIADNEDELAQSMVDLHESLEAVARHADAIARNLEVTTRNMDEFSQQIRDDPGVLLRGRDAAEEPGSK